MHAWSVLGRGRSPLLRSLLGAQASCRQARRLSRPSQQPYIQLSSNNAIRVAPASRVKRCCAQNSCSASTRPAQWLPAAGLTCGGRGECRLGGWVARQAAGRPSSLMAAKRLRRATRGTRFRRSQSLIAAALACTPSVVPNSRKASRYGSGCRAGQERGSGSPDFWQAWCRACFAAAPVALPLLTLSCRPARCSRQPNRATPSLRLVQPLLLQK